MRDMYHINGVTDLSVLKANAEKLTIGDSRNKPTPVVIHHHRVGEQCLGAKHDEYNIKEKA